jgi:DNA-binding beta-propeller fold protein YncE
MPNLPLAGSKLAPGIAALVALLWLATASAADPYTSTGFLKFPPEVELGAMSAVAIDAHDRIYALHRGEPPLVAFDASGNYVRAWGTGLFKVPHGLRVDRDGNIWTTDNGNDVIRKFNPEGRLVATLNGQHDEVGLRKMFRAPDDLVFDSQGNIFVADSGNGRIVKLSPEGTYLKDWGSKGKQPGQFATAHDLAISNQPDKPNRIFVGDRGNKRIQVFDTDGKYLTEWTGFGNPFGLLVVGHELLASEGDIHKIFHLDLTSGQVTASWGDPQMLLLPHFMAVNSKGTLFICEVNGKRVQTFERAK